MRPTSRFTVNSESPRARGVCERCGQHWQLTKLAWQFQWVGPKLQNLRNLVCPECLDKPQPNLRTIVIPPDPVPVMNARPENYVSDDNGTILASTGLTGQSSLVQRSGGLSGIGVCANFATPQYGSRIGNLTGAGGLNAAFDGNLIKQSWLSAANKTISDSSFNNYVGVNWQGNVSNLNMPSSLLPPVLTHSLLGVTITSPIDRTFLDTSATSFVVQASAVDTTLFAAWTTLASGTTAGTHGESIVLVSSQISPNPVSQFHRVAFLGDSVNYVSVAQVQFSVGEIGGTQ